MKQFNIAIPLLLIIAFLQCVANGRGQIIRDMALGNGHLSRSFNDI
ncbi:MAG: hypothetical protein LBS55_14840 [Prevotellaceae bacterium]|jgi:hypothetical protein|nr:hypothetical protein [Prevotellaceae bacterium]